MKIGTSDEIATCEIQLEKHAHIGALDAWIDFVCCSCAEDLDGADPNGTIENSNEYKYLY